MSCCEHMRTCQLHSTTVFCRIALRCLTRQSVLACLLAASGCEDRRASDSASPPAPAVGTDMTPLQRVNARVNQDGDVNDPSSRRPLLTLSEFFDGNDDHGSLGCNLTPPPGPRKFQEVLQGIASRQVVSDVRVQITMQDDPEAWPFSDTVWIITSAPPDTVVEWFEPSLRPDECSAGWTEGVEFEPVEVPEGMRPVACWWD